MANLKESGSEMPQAGLVFTVREFCGQARISTRLFYRLQEKGKGPKVIRLGRRVLIAQETAMRWLMDQENIAIPSKAAAFQFRATDLTEKEMVSRAAPRNRPPTGRTTQGHPAFLGTFGKRQPW